MEAYFWLVKNFFWILVGTLLIRRPIREFAARAANSELTQPNKAWMILRLLVGLYCIAVSVWNLFSGALLNFLHPVR